MFCGGLALSSQPQLPLWVSWGPGWEWAGLGWHCKLCSPRKKGECEGRREMSLPGHCQMPELHLFLSSRRSFHSCWPEHIPRLCQFIQILQMSPWPLRNVEDSWFIVSPVIGSTILVQSSPALEILPWSLHALCLSTQSANMIWVHLIFGMLDSKISNDP